MIIMPILTKKGDKRVLLNGEPPKVDCRVLAEETFQELLVTYIEKRTQELEDLKKEIKIKY